MKHTFNVVLILILLFVFAQLIGLAVINKYFVQELPYDIQKPEFEEQTSFIPIFLIVIFGTILVLILIYFRAERIWKLWFFLSVIFTLLIAFSAFINQVLALLFAVVLALIKVYKPNVIVHNLTEVFIYGGLAAIFVPVLSVLSISILLILISIYDMIAVWKTKHMIKLAKFQSKLKVFAGLIIPYGKNKTAILGGGDIGFPLLFSGTILKTYGLIDALITVVFTSLALLTLLILAEKKKYYPAMPFISIGCFIGLLVINFIM